MKGYKLLWMLYSRSVLYKMLVLMIGIILLDGAAFLFKMQDAVYLAQAIPENVWEFGFIVSVLILMLIFVIPKWIGSGQSDYTIQRFGIDRKKAYLVRAAFQALCLLVLTAFQGVVLVLLCFGFEGLAQNQIPGSQNVPMVFYRNAFLHSLMPLADTARLIRNLVMIFGFGVVSAIPIRKNHKDYAKIILITLYTAFFVITFGAIQLMNLFGDAMLIIAASVMSGIAVGFVLSKEADKDEESI